MQELLGRLKALDPEASLGLRVIACFDELIVGNVNTRALLSAAASLAGCPAGFLQDAPVRSMRVGTDGTLMEPATVHPEAEGETLVDAAGGFAVWLERQGPPQANDAITLERLALAMRIRHGRLPRDQHQRRDLGVLVDAEVSSDQRLRAAVRLGLEPDTRMRVVVAPLFAAWSGHPHAREDVVSTAFGPMHVLLVPEEHRTVSASPSGVGPARNVAGLPNSFRAAMIALRLATPPHVPSVSADEYGGLLELLSEVPVDQPAPDAELIGQVASHPWGSVTLEAIAKTGSLREAARHAGVHHSTMRYRLDTVAVTLGFDPLDGVGRVRFGIAYLLWRLRESHVLELPSPQEAPARAS